MLLKMNAKSSIVSFSEKTERILDCLCPVNTAENILSVAHRLLSSKNLISQAVNLAVGKLKFI